MSTFVELTEPVESNQNNLDCMLDWRMLVNNVHVCDSLKQFRILENAFAISGYRRQIVSDSLADSVRDFFHCVHLQKVLFPEHLLQLFFMM